MTSFVDSKTNTRILQASLLLIVTAFVGCGLNQAPHAEATLRSSNQMKDLILAIRNYREVNEDQWPEQLSDVRSLTDTSFDVLMRNPITGDNPGYEYVPPPENADLETTVILYQLQNGQRATDLRVGYADGHVAEIDSSGTEN